MRCPTLAELPPPPPGKSGWPWTAESARGSERSEEAPWPRISVVTPSYNQGAFLEATIRSVLLQGYPDLEYVVMDGGSTDESVEAIRKYEPWLAYWTSGPDGGQYDAINKGFARTTGEIMTWLNSDDMYVPDSFWIVGSVFASLAGDVEWITGLPGFWNEQGKPCTVFSYKRYDRSLIELGLYQGQPMGFVQQEGTFWSRSLWTRAGGALDKDLQFAGDFELWCRFAHHAALYTVPMLLARYRAQPNQKMALQPKRYNREVDQLLSGSRSAGLLRHFLATKAGHLAVRLYLKMKRERYVIGHDARTNQWELG